MKRISLILTAFALVLTMTQCKKNEGTNSIETVTITFDVKGNCSSKVDVNTITGTVNFETGDKVYVGSGGKYVGYLMHNGTNFVGNITDPTENQPLQFYFLGNVTPAETLSAGTTEECSVIISDQTEHLPVISCTASNENYVSGVTAYTGHLLNKCALVKFNVTTPSNTPICITGMNNKVTVDFTQNTITPSQYGEGVIKLPAGSGENVEKWAILLPQEALEEGEEGSVYSEDGSYTGIRPEISGIIENGYLADGIVVAVNNNSAPIGAINGLFTINSNGDQVYFSQGNLQYIGSASTPYWKFADYQWDYLGDNGQFSEEHGVDRDLFCWATSGFNHGAVCYQPWSTNGDANNYYAYGSLSFNLYDQTGRADWGYNDISNGGNAINQWRTLTKDEWIYVFTVRSTVSGVRYAKAKVNDVKGVILLPDNWSTNYYSLVNTNNGNASFNSNTITESIWLNSFESHGAVFLPAAGYRNGVNGGPGPYSAGFYWSSSSYGGQPYAYGLAFTESVLNDDSYGSRGAGQSVRLIKACNH